MPRTKPRPVRNAALLRQQAEQAETLKNVIDEVASELPQFDLFDPGELEKIHQSLLAEMRGEADTKNDAKATKERRRFKRLRKAGERRIATRGAVRGGHAAGPWDWVEDDDKKEAIDRLVAAAGISRGKNRFKRGHRLGDGTESSAEQPRPKKLRIPAVKKPKPKPLRSLGDAQRSVEIGSLRVLLSTENNLRFEAILGELADTEGWFVARWENAHPRSTTNTTGTLFLAPSAKMCATAASGAMEVDKKTAETAANGTSDDGTIDKNKREDGGGGTPSGIMNQPKHAQVTFQAAWAGESKDTEQQKRMGFILSSLEKLVNMGQVNVFVRPPPPKAAVPAPYTLHIGLAASAMVHVDDDGQADGEDTPSGCTKRGRGRKRKKDGNVEKARDDGKAAAEKDEGDPTTATANDERVVVKEEGRKEDDGAAKEDGVAEKERKSKLIPKPPAHLARYMLGERAFQKHLRMLLLALSYKTFSHQQKEKQQQQQAIALANSGGGGKMKGLIGRAFASLASYRREDWGLPRKSKEQRCMRQHADLIPRLRRYQLQAATWMKRREEIFEEATRAPDFVSIGCDVDVDVDVASSSSSRTLIHYPLWDPLPILAQWNGRKIAGSSFSSLSGKDAPVGDNKQNGDVTAEAKTLFWNRCTGHVTRGPLARIVDRIAPVPGGILAEEMGLGKTIETLHLIAARKRPPHTCTTPPLPPVKTENQNQIKRKKRKKTSNRLQKKRTTTRRDSSSRTARDRPRHPTAGSAAATRPKRRAVLERMKKKNGKKGETSRLREEGTKWEGRPRPVSRRLSSGSRNSYREEGEKWEGRPMTVGRRRSKSGHDRSDQENDRLEEEEKDEGGEAKRMESEKEEQEEEDDGEVHAGSEEEEVDEWKEESEEEEEDMACPVCEMLASQTRAGVPWVGCDHCDTWSHAHCVQHDADDKEAPFCCPFCWRDRCQETPMAVKTTLIVSPAAIVGQWAAEIKKHTREGTMRVCFYDGLRGDKARYLSPAYLGQFDVVLTTYGVLRSEIHRARGAGFERTTFRRKRRRRAAPSPLVDVEWWRLVIDEAQMAESTTAMAAQMCQKLRCVHRWAVTGTPINRSLNDLQGLLVFLKAQPYCNRNNWRRDVLDPLTGNAILPPFSVALKRLGETVGPLFWRKTKAEVKNELGLPPQKELVVRVNFSEVEAYNYDRLKSDCQGKALSALRSWGHEVPPNGQNTTGNGKKKSGTASTTKDNTIDLTATAEKDRAKKQAVGSKHEKKVMVLDGNGNGNGRGPSGNGNGNGGARLEKEAAQAVLISLLALRQACCHPMLGRAANRAFARSSESLLSLQRRRQTTMEAFLAQLIQREEKELTRAVRTRALVLNGLAGIAKVRGFYQKAANFYAQTLLLAQTKTFFTTAATARDNHLIAAQAHQLDQKDAESRSMVDRTQQLHAAHHLRALLEAHPDVNPPANLKPNMTLPSSGNSTPSSTPSTPLPISSSNPGGSSPDKSSPGSSASAASEKRGGVLVGIPSLAPPGADEKRTTTTAANTAAGGSASDKILPPTPPSAAKTSTNLCRATAARRRRRSSASYAAGRWAKALARSNSNGSSSGRHHDHPNSSSADQDRTSQSHSQSGAEREPGGEGERGNGRGARRKLKKRRKELIRWLAATEEGIRTRYITTARYFVAQATKDAEAKIKKAGSTWRNGKWSGAHPWWLNALSSLSTSETRAETFLTRVMDGLTSRSSGVSARLLDRARSIEGLQYVIATSLQSVHALRNKVVQELRRLHAPDGPTREDVIRAGNCGVCCAELGRKGAACKHCKCRRVLNEYEAKIFQTRALGSGTRTAAMNASAAKAFDDPGHVVDAQQESEVLLILRTLFTVSAGRRAAMGAQSSPVDWIEAVKREYFALSAWWKAQKQELSEMDELEMSVLTIRLQDTNEKVLEEQKEYILPRWKLSPKEEEFKMLMEKARLDCATKVGQLFYLRSLTKHGGGGTNGSGGSTNGGGEKIGNDAAAEKENKDNNNGNDAATRKFDCPVCLSKISPKKSGLIVFSCGHVVCYKCGMALLELAQKRHRAYLKDAHHRPNKQVTVQCPKCRTQTPDKDIGYVERKENAEATGATPPGTPGVNGSGSPKDEHMTSLSGTYGAKINAVVTKVLRLRASDPSVKVVIFSQWHEVLSLLADALSYRGLSYEMPKTTSKRHFQKAIDRFKRPYVPPEEEEKIEEIGPQDLPHNGTNTSTAVATGADHGDAVASRPPSASSTSCASTPANNKRKRVPPPLDLNSNSRHNASSERASPKGVAAEAPRAPASTEPYNQGGVDAKDEGHKSNRGGGSALIQASVASSTTPGLTPRAQRQRRRGRRGRGGSRKASGAMGGVGGVGVLLLQLKSGGQGLNLTEATHVMFVDPSLNPAQHLQAAGRVHRIGQTRRSFVHWFLIKNSIEEVIYQLHCRRRNDTRIGAASAKERDALSVDDVGALLNSNLT